MRHKTYQKIDIFHLFLYKLETYKFYETYDISKDKYIKDCIN